MTPQAPIATGVEVSPNPPTDIESLSPNVGQYKIGFVDATFFTSAHAVALHLYTLASDTQHSGPGTCQVDGTGVPAN